MGIILLTFRNEQPTELRQGKSHAACVNLSPLHIETFASCVRQLAPFLWSGFEAYERCWTDNAGLEPSVFHTWALWVCLRPTDLKGQPPTMKRSQMPPPWQRLAGSPPFSAAWPRPPCTEHSSPPVHHLAQPLAHGWRLWKRKGKNWLMEGHSGAAHGCAQHER